jgi:Ca2+-binding EF-hand superfamily protein
MLIKAFNGHKQAGGANGTPVTEYLAGAMRSCDKENTGTIECMQLMEELQKQGIVLTSSQSRILQERFGADKGIAYNQMLQFVKDGIASPKKKTLLEMEAHLNPAKLPLQHSMQPKQSEQPTQNEQPTQSEQPKQSEQPTQNEQPKQIEQPTQSVQDQHPIDQDLTSLKSLFDKLDIDSSGTVDKKEWGHALSQNKEALAKFLGGETLSEIGKQFNRIDADQSGDLTWEEVKSAVLEQAAVQNARSKQKQQKQKQKKQQQTQQKQKQPKQKQPKQGEAAKGFKDDDIVQYVIVDPQVRDSDNKAFSKGRMAAQVSHVSVKATNEYVIKQRDKLAQTYVDELEGQMTTVVFKLRKGVGWDQVTAIFDAAEGGPLQWVKWNENPEKVDVALALAPIRFSSYKTVQASMRDMVQLY